MTKLGRSMKTETTLDDAVKALPPGWGVDLHPDDKSSIWFCQINNGVCCHDSDGYWPSAVEALRKSALKIGVVI